MLLLACSLFLGAVPAEDEAVVKEVEQAVRTLNQAFTRHDAATLRKLMTDDHVAITSYYGRATKADQLTSLADLKFQEYKETDMKVTVLTKDAVLITYQLALKGTFKGKDVPPKNYATAVWVKRNGTWQEAAYTETPVGGN